MRLGMQTSEVNG